MRALVFRSHCWFAIRFPNYRIYSSMCRNERYRHCRIGRITLKEAK